MANGKYCVLRYKKGILAFGIKDNRLNTINYYNETSNLHIGDVYVAKVINVLHNIDAAFIHFKSGAKGFLPIDSKITPILLNREYYGRILAGDELLVQLEKEAIRTKEPVFSTQISISGKYCVITYGNATKGVSSKIDKKSKEILNECIPETDYGVIVRTNALSLIDENRLDLLREEISFLTDKMTKLLSNGIHRTCYSKLYEAPASYLLELRDNYNQDYDSIVTDDEAIYDELKEFSNRYLHNYIDKLELYQDNSFPLAKLYSIETKLSELLNKQVWLKSGAYLVIEQTEAMYVVDVNSGKNVSKKENAKYIYDINCEAADEIMRQISLRNLSGIIIVDFINMTDKNLQAKLLEYLRNLAKKDVINTTIVDITPLNLIEITRKKVKKSLKDQLCKD